MGDLDFKVGAETSKFDEGMRAVQATALEAAEGIKGAFEGVSRAFEAINLAMAGIAAALAGGAAFKEAIAATVNLNVQSMDLGKQFGISATQASVLKTALSETHVTQEQLSAAGARVLRTLTTNEGAFKELGVATRDASGNFRPLADIILDTNSALLRYKEGTDRGVEATKIYGRGWLEIAPTLRLTRESMLEAAQTARELNLTVSAESEAATQKYRSAMVEVNHTFEGLSNTIGQVLMPVLTDLAEWFRSTGPAAIDVTKGVLATIIEAFIELRRECKNALEYITGSFAALGIQLQGWARTANAALHLDFKGATAAHEAYLADERALYKNYLDAVVANNKQAADAVAALNEQAFGPQHATKGPGGDKGSSGGKDQFDKRLEGWIKELDLEYAALKKQHDSELEVYKQQEAEFSKAAGARISIAEAEVEAEARAYGKGSPEYEKAQLHLVQVKQQANEQLLKMAEEFSRNETDGQLRALADQEKLLQEQLQHREITNAQFESMEIALENRRTTIAEAGIKSRQALIDPDHDPVQAAQLDAQLEALEQDHQQKLTQIRQQAAQRDKLVWDQFGDSIQRDFATSLAKMLEGTQTFSNGLKNLFVSLTKTIADTFAQMATKNIATMLSQAVAGKSIRAQEIMDDAKSAAAAAFKAVAGIPVIGPVIAPAVAAGAFAAVAAFDSAEEGYEVPRGLQPITQLHSREMVLPETLADRVRAVTPDASGGGGGGGGDVHLHVHAMDTQGVKQFLNNNRRYVADAVHSHLRATGRTSPGH